MQRQTCMVEDCVKAAKNPSPFCNSHKCNLYNERRWEGKVYSEKYNWTKEIFAVKNYCLDHICSCYNCGRKVCRSFKHCSTHLHASRLYDKIYAVFDENIATEKVLQNGCKARCEDDTQETGTQKTGWGEIEDKGEPTGKRICFRLIGQEVGEDIFSPYCHHHQCNHKKCDRQSQVFMRGSPPSRVHNFYCKQHNCTAYMLNCKLRKIKCQTASIPSSVYCRYHADAIPKRVTVYLVMKKYGMPRDLIIHFLKKMGLYYG